MESVSLQDSILVRAIRVNLLEQRDPLLKYSGLNKRLNFISFSHKQVVGQLFSTKPLKVLDSFHLSAVPSLKCLYLNDQNWAIALPDFKPLAKEKRGNRRQTIFFQTSEVELAHITEASISLVKTQPHGCS